MRSRSTFRITPRAALAVLAFVSVGRPALAGDTPTVQNILERTGHVVENFVEQLSAVRCKEEVMQVKLAKNGRPQYKQETQYDSLLLIRLEGNDLSVEESRQPERQAGNGANLPLLVTGGFAALAMIFHPYYQSSFEFTRLEDEQIEGRAFLRVEFRHIPGTPSPAAYQLHGREYPLALTGTAWIHPETAAILRITTSLSGNMQDIGLRALRSDVEYGPVTLTDAPQPIWLPLRATVDVESLQQHWRNTHAFSGYRRFRVTVKIDSEVQP